MKSGHGSEIYERFWERASRYRISSNYGQDLKVRKRANLIRKCSRYTRIRQC